LVVAAAEVVDLPALRVAVVAPVDLELMFLVIH
jgi:hypothetical protein